MDDLISRQAAIDAIANCTNCGDEKTLRAYVAKHNLDNGWTGGVLEAIDAIEDLPSAKPERKTGKWIELDSDEDRYDEIKCPHCRHMFTVDTYHWTDIGFTKSDLKFCPNCGADMRGEQDD